MNLRLFEEMKGNSLAIFEYTYEVTCLSSYRSNGSSSILKILPTVLLKYLWKSQWLYYVGLIASKGKKTQSNQSIDSLIFAQGLAPDVSSWHLWIQDSLEKFFARNNFNGYRILKGFSSGSATDTISIDTTFFNVYLQDQLHWKLWRKNKDLQKEFQV